MLWRGDWIAGSTKGTWVAGGTSSQPEKRVALPPSGDGNAACSCTAVAANVTDGAAADTCCWPAFGSAASDIDLEWKDKLKNSAKL